MTRPSSLFLAAALSLTAVACGPMEVEVVNETGADLVLDMGEHQEIVPPGTTMFDYKGAPSLNKRWDMGFRVRGDYVLTELTVEGSRDNITTLVFDESDVNAFVAEISNDTGDRIDSLFLEHPSEAGRPLEDGLRPGTNYGPLASGESVEVPLRYVGADGYNYVYYQQGVGTVDTSGRVNAESAGQHVQISL